MREFVTVRHPDVNAAAVVPRSALPYLDPAWQVVDEPAPQPDDAPQPLDDAAGADQPTTPAAAASEDPTTPASLWPHAAADHLQEENL